MASKDKTTRGKAAIVDLSGSSDASELAPGSEWNTLIWKNSPLKSFPQGISVKQKLDLSGSIALRELPRGLSVSVLNLTGCTRLAALPEEMQVDFLNIDGCTALETWPESAKVRIGTVSARGCHSLRALPSELGPLTTLDLRDCFRVDRIAEGVQVGAWIDIGGTRIESLPKQLAATGLRWRGVRITPQIAFFPETLTATEALAEGNAEVRRVMIERMGFEKFIAESKAKLLHHDTDAGGARQLLQVDLADDEPLVCVSVKCPSTGRHYLIRVPPTMKTCHQAVAWTAGFDNPDDYQPVAET